MKPCSVTGAVPAAYETNRCRHPAMKIRKFVNENQKFQTDMTRNHLIAPGNPAGISYARIRNSNGLYASASPPMDGFWD